MKDLTDRELLDAIDRAMRIVVARFQAQRDASDVASMEPRPAAHEPEAAAASRASSRPISMT